MARIKGKFLPLFEEIVYDERFLYKMNEFQKLVYILIMFAAYMNENRAPISPSYYIKRYNLGFDSENGHEEDGYRTIDGRAADALRKRVGRAMDRCRTLFPKMRFGKDYISFDNYAGYVKHTKTLAQKNEQKVSGEIEIEREIEQEGKSNLENFEKFWKSYPKRKSKGQAQRAWLKLKPTEQLCGAIFTALERAKTSADWVKEQGKYIPYPATWLNAHGWEDEYEQDTKTKKARDEWNQPFPVQQTSTYSNTQEATSA